MTELCAVLTGDLVGSSQADPHLVSLAFEALVSADDEVRSWFGAAPSSALQRHRGDGWQAFVPLSVYALRAACVYSAAVAAVDKRMATRISVGIGRIAELSDDGLGASSGRAFELSGRGLEQMGKSSRLSARADETVLHRGWIEAVFDLADVIVSGWTPRQAVVAQYLLVRNAPSQAELGDRLGISQQAVQDHFSRAHGMALSAACDRLESGFNK